MSLYRKYRPQRFSELIGQQSAVEVLTNSIAKSFVGHAYLFSGSRGCGKTSAARIFARALNCLNPQGPEPCCECRNCIDIAAGQSLDVIEIDGASATGVDNIRDLKEHASLAPFSSKYKIYIIDEVHMLSSGAFNALLKIVEEPPEHVIFIMATTEPQKVPVTIRSRCQHIPFHSITPEDIFARLTMVCESESIYAEPEALREIARQADGALRDALSMLEQVAAKGDVRLSSVESTLGAGSRPSFERWLVKMRSDPPEAYSSLRAMFEAGASGSRVFEEMFSLVRDMWLFVRWPKIIDSLGLSEQEKEFLVNESTNWSEENLHAMLGVIVRILGMSNNRVRPDILLGMFTLYLEAGTPAPEPELPKVALRREPVAVTPAVTPKPEPEPAPKPKPNYDAELKEQLLTIAHERDFVVFAALFDAQVFADSNSNLFLDMNHAYCFELLKAAQNVQALNSMFEMYRSITIRNGLNEYPCPKHYGGNLFAEFAETPVERPVPRPEPAMPVYEPEPVREEPVIPAEPPAVQSKLDEFLNRVRTMGMNYDVLFTRRKEQDESELLESESDTEGETEA